MTESEAPIKRHDAVVIGAGIAGLTAARYLRRENIALIAPRFPGAGGSTPKALGGIAAAMGPDDSPADHAEDTIELGAGLCNRRAVEILAEEIPDRIEDLIDLGAEFDYEDGELALGREAGHGRRRIVHGGGDATGQTVIKPLVRDLRVEMTNCTFHRGTGLRLLKVDGRVCGVLVQSDGTFRVHLAPCVVLATGGTGGLYKWTTNPSNSTGDGIAMAFRAGACVADLEFVQFHPTGLASFRSPLPLLSEALRGEGACLRDESGSRVMEGVHPEADLAPRDVVARTVWRYLKRGQPVFLDLEEAQVDLKKQFPKAYRAITGMIPDPNPSQIPIRPVAHYHMGGVATGPHGETTVPGLWACGEVANTGLHGANRMASNSLAEGLVFGRRVGEAINQTNASIPSPAGRAANELLRGLDDSETIGSDSTQRFIRQKLWKSVGLERRADELEQLESTLTEKFGDGPPRPVATRNLVLVARLITEAAARRTETRRAHYRTDFPDRDDSMRCRQVASLSNGAGRRAGEAFQIDWSQCCPDEFIPDASRSPPSEADDRPGPGSAG